MSSRKASNSSSSSSMPLSSYHQIREQIVALSVELEDRSRVCQMMEGKIESERILLSQIDQTLGLEFQRKIDAINVKHKTDMTSISSSTNNLLERKKQLIDHCKNAIDELKLCFHSLCFGNVRH